MPASSVSSHLALRRRNAPLGAHSASSPACRARCRPSVLAVRLAAAAQRLAVARYLAPPSRKPLAKHARSSTASSTHCSAPTVCWSSSARNWASSARLRSRRLASSRTS
eukprot:scaffold2628_cov67-Phaeocystis_antarctica.AAC.3